MPEVHPILACATDVGAALKDVAGVDPTFMPPADKEAALVALTEVADRVAELRLRVLAAADDVAEQHGAKDAGQWLAHRTRATRPSSARERRLAVALEGHGPVREALAEGRIRLDQAAVICRSVDALPDRVGDRVVGPDVRVRARAHLLELAAHHDARDLHRLGKRLLDVVAPELGEAHEARLLAAEEERAARAASFTMVDDGNGSCHGRFTLPTLTGRMLQRHLLALANPRRIQDAGDVPETPSTTLPERLGAALVEYVERYPADHTPESGGVSATVVVTMSLESLLGGLGAASLDDGQRISAAQARRLACEAGLVPAVLGSASQPLDLGRRVRLHTRAQRIALGLRDGGCTAQGCGLPPSACHAHHDDPWARGGSTTVSRGRLLCARHHGLAHHDGYEMRVHADNSVTFHRRT